MMKYLYGIEARNNRHATCVKKVYRYLKTKCDKADYERKLVASRITDAVGYNTKSKLWYLCEIKVNESDLQKAANQIYDTALRFPYNSRYKKGDIVIPVIAIPSKLHKQLRELVWKSLCEMCKKLGVSLWVVEQSGVRELLNPKISKAMKSKSSRALGAKKISSKISTQKRISKTIKKKTNKKNASPKKAIGKTTKIKRQVKKSKKANTSGVRVTKRKTSKKKY